MDDIPRTTQELIVDLAKEVKLLKRRFKINEKQPSTILSAFTIIDILAEMGWSWYIAELSVTKSVSVRIRFWDRSFRTTDIREYGHRNFPKAVFAIIESEKFKKWLLGIK